LDFDQSKQSSLNLRLVFFLLTAHCRPRFKPITHKMRSTAKAYHKGLITLAIADYFPTNQNKALTD